MKLFIRGQIVNIFYVLFVKYAVDFYGFDAVEHLNHLGEVGEGARLAVDLVHNDGGGLPLLDIPQQPLQAGAFQLAAGDAAVVLWVAYRYPAREVLIGDIGLARFALGIERHQALLRSFFRELPSLNRRSLLSRLRRAKCETTLRGIINDRFRDAVSRREGA